MAKGLRFRRIVEMLGRIPLSMVMLLGGFFEVLGADTAIQPRMLLGVYPDRPLVLKRTSCNAFDAFADGSRFVCANGTSVAYVKYLPALHAAMVVEAENDENTLHQDWTVISIVPLGAFAKE